MAANVQSPLADVELLLVQMCIQMGKIGQPLSVCEAVWAMNGLIEGTMHEEALREYQELHKLGSERTRGSCGRNWWGGFLRRQEENIVTKRGEHFAKAQDDWAKHSHIAQMYDVIYDEFVAAGVAVKLDTPVFTNREGKKLRRVSGSD